MEKKWYAVHTQTGCEDKVKLNIESRAKTSRVENFISQVLVPVEKVSEVKDGKKKISTRKFFPGYVLVEMELTDDTWYLIKNTPGVSGFIGSGRKPVSLHESEITAILKQAEIAKEKPTPKVIFEKSEEVRVLEGPFTNFNGTIEEINPAKGKLKVSISIFGRSTPVELEYWQVEKV
ncbi:MAG: transcription termination/antitermination protein NusG [Candidatus Omnitrophota bacterium]|nr:transcription termination/antitermination protein NusG [Candidatus Omnitrophota bacterium]